MGGIVRWRILAAMLLTGYALFFGGLFVSARTLATLYPTLPGYSIASLTVVTSTVFMHNLVQTPAYAILPAVQGKTVNLMGSSTQPHIFTYIKDFGTPLATLGTQAEALELSNYQDFADAYHQIG